MTNFPQSDFVFLNNLLYHYIEFSSTLGINHAKRPRHDELSRSKEPGPTDGTNCRLVQKGCVGC